MKTGRLGSIGMILLLFLSGAVHSQQRCEWRPEGPLGPAWYEPGGLSACDNNIPQQPTTPPARWATRWGAVAIDHHNSEIGTITDQSTESGAKRIAIERCGSSNCKIEVSYGNQCVAIAWGTRYSATKIGLTIEQASKRAMQTCKKAVDDCKVILAECSLPERIQ